MHVYGKITVHLANPKNDISCKKKSEIRLLKKTENELLYNDLYKVSQHDHSAFALRYHSSYYRTIQVTIGKLGLIWNVPHPHKLFSFLPQIQSKHFYIRYLL